MHHTINNKIQIKDSNNKIQNQKGRRAGRHPEKRGFRGFNLKRSAKCKQRKQRLSKAIKDKGYLRQIQNSK